MPNFPPELLRHVARAATPVTARALKCTNHFVNNVIANQDLIFGELQWRVNGGDYLKTFEWIARKGHLTALAVLFRFIASKCPLEYVKHIKNNLLGFVSGKGHADLVSWLVAEGADVHTRGDFPLCSAVKEGHVAVVEVLIGAGADIHTRNDWPLIMAAENGHHTLAEVLIGAGADIHSQDDASLQLAARFGHDAVVEVLIGAGADIHTQDDMPLQVAARHGHDAVVKVLIGAGADIHTRDDWPLIVAAENGHLRVVAILLGAGANPAADDAASLMFAARNGHTQIVSLLLLNLPHANVRDVRGAALTVAARKGHGAVVSALLTDGARPGDPNYAMNIGARYGHEKVVAACLVAGADFMGITASFGWAAHNGFDKIITCLLAEVAMQPGVIAMGLLCASRQGHHSTVTSLLAAAAKSVQAVEPAIKMATDSVKDISLFHAVQNGYQETVSQMLEEGARLSGAKLWDLDMVDSRFAGPFGIIDSIDMSCDRTPSSGPLDTTVSPLITTAQNGYDTILSLLIESGEDILPEGEEMLFEASRNGHHKIVSLLIEAGVDVRAGDGKALTLAEAGGHVAVVEVLMKALEEVDDGKGAGVEVAAPVDGGESTEVGV